MHIFDLMSLVQILWCTIYERTMEVYYYKLSLPLVDFKYSTKHGCGCQGFMAVNEPSLRVSINPLK